ncbi:DUF2515 family protein [Paenibacillus hodogayensis]|uniref:DUF2515 family protein n=1 Tax=Paenibacillus hodogayensis TaxID=279208 RepID=A0ABV5VU07_9BACL
MNGTNPKERHQWGAIWKRLQAVPGNVAGYWSGKLSGWMLSAKLSKTALPLDIEGAEVSRLRQAAGTLQGAQAPKLTAEERALVEAIRDETARHNRNNVTRTAAYWRLYERRPELHWAFLAHLVSRNGGWSMTDLKGELVSRLLARSRSEAIFAFLENANSLIFQDAYPQLLLYEASLRRSRPLFHLLPSFHVSAFMRPVWEQFWRERRSPLLTVALIVNEQHYIEKRIVQNERFRRTVLETPAFQAQALLQLNIVVFPYVADKQQDGSEAAPPSGDYRLAGLILENFSDLRERIEFGKRLYALLFAVPSVTSGARSFASSRSHTGSRADYWPHLFASLNKSVPLAKYAEKLDGGKLLPDAVPLYSPKLEQAWRDVAFEPPERFDWFTGSSVPYRFMSGLSTPLSFEITHEYAFALNKLELAVLAGELMFD